MMELPRVLGGRKITGDTGLNNVHDHNVFHLPNLDKITASIARYSQRLIDIEMEVNAKYKEHADTQFKLNTALDNLREKLEAAVPTHNVEITPRVSEPSTEIDVQMPTHTPMETIDE